MNSHDWLNFLNAAIEMSSDWLFSISGQGLTNFLLVVVGGGQYVIFRRQSRIMDRQADLMSGQLTAATTAANAAKEATKSLPRIERAYVFIDVELVQYPYLGSNGLVTVNIIVNVKNHGKTPARLCGVRAYATTGQSAPQELTDIGDLEQEIPSALVITSGEPYLVDLNLSTKKIDWENIENNNVFIYCCGRVDYLDIFEKQHSTGFCWYFQHRDGTATFQLTPNTPLNFIK